jgi:hypothetical protein
MGANSMNTKAPRCLYTLFHFAPHQEITVPAFAPLAL